MIEADTGRKDEEAIEIDQTAAAAGKELGAVEQVEESQKKKKNKGIRAFFRQLFK